ncbi:HAMP domain-containing sensor histidine kinase [Wukongibacter baidiensis]|uniref:sensor histidine kinase n=1 Tax=Wukongibacter baidiensis TaxID=1723361 RepID=UPI003D7F385E
MKKSLSLKLFATIFFAFVVMITGIVFALDIYFNNFYENIKIENTIKRINEFANDYSQNKWNKEELYRQTNLFSSSNNVTMAIRYEKDNDNESNEESDHEKNESNEKLGHEKNESNFVLITTVDSENNYFDFFISSERYMVINLNKGDTIELVGYLRDSEVIVPTSVNGVMLENGETTESEYKSFKNNVKIVDIKDNLTLPNLTETEETNYVELVSKKINGVEYKISEIPHTGIKQVDFTKGITNEEGIKTIFFVNASLQPISETLNVIKNFYPYFFIFSLILSFIISLIYSIGVTKPIRNITNVADDMAKMNFDRKLDITREDELGKLSNSLNTLSSSLETALKELTVANEKLKEDYEKEVKQEQARKEFIANASHELKTPLGVIKGYAEGIKDDINEEERDEYIDVITDEIRKMDKLIFEMLRISKYDSMDIKIEKEKTDMLVLINDVVQTFEKLLSKNRLLVNITGEFGICCVDREKVSSAFLNLFSNAVKYAVKNSKITIKGISLEGKTRIEIQNDCKPFTDEELEKVWERFYKVDTSHNRDIEGTGLGLSIVKSIFDAHKIKYGVYNTQKGVAFWFEIQND